MAWAKIPTAWITIENKLPEFSWQYYRSNATAALILFIALAIRLNLSNIKSLRGKNEIQSSFEESYDNLQDVTQLSRAKIAGGLRLLLDKEIISVSHKKRTNRYFLSGIQEAGKWAMLPQDYLLANNVLKPFAIFHLRHRNELNALKLYLLLLAFRDVRTNSASIGYETICDRSGIMKNDIRRALSLLINYELVNVFRKEPFERENVRPYNSYLISGF